jgi:hypothetical protein
VSNTATISQVIIVHAFKLLNALEISRYETAHSAHKESFFHTILTLNTEYLPKQSPTGLCNGYALRALPRRK